MLPKVTLSSLLELINYVVIIPLIRRKVDQKCSKMGIGSNITQTHLSSLYEVLSGH